jgi:hypothetical protein
VPENFLQMAKKDPDPLPANDITVNREAEAVKESIEKKELQNLILRKLINGIRTPGIPNNPDKTIPGRKE